MANYNYGMNYGSAFANNPTSNQNPYQFNNPIVYGNQNNTQMSDGSLMAVFVQGEAGANSYPVASGNTVMPIDFESGKFWLKSNANGIPQRLRHFEFHEVFPNQENTPSVNVSREEFDGLSKSVSALSDSVNKLIAELGGTSNESQ